MMLNGPMVFLHSRGPGATIQLGVFAWIQIWAINQTAENDHLLTPTADGDKGHRIPDQA